MLIRLRLRSNPDSPAENREFRLDALRMGRAPSADLVVPDDSAHAVSWQHARIDATPDGAMLHDLRSTNGTFLNGRKIEGPERLRVGDRIQFGQTGPVLEIVLLSANAPPPYSQPQPPPPPAFDRPRPLSSSPPMRGGSAQPAQMSATRALLVGMQKKQKKWMIFGISGLAVAGLAIMIVLIRHEVRLDDLDEQVAHINSKFVDFETDLDTIKARQGEIDQSTQTFYADTDALDKAVASGNAKSETIYQRAVRSTAWITTDQGGDGSGTLIAHNGKLLIVTSYHVVQGARVIGVRFPRVLDGKVLSNSSHYISSEVGGPGSPAISCRVWAANPGVDLAVLEPISLPAELRPLRISDVSVEPAAPVHTVGANVAGTNALWSYSNGSVRQIAGPTTMRTRTGRSVTAKTVETQNPVNNGDSGGPLVNKKCELVGVTFGGVEGANLVTRFIDISHVRDVLHTQPVPPPEAPATPAPPPVTPNPTPPSVPSAPSAAGARGHVHVLLLIDDCDDFRKNRQPGIAQSVRQDEGNLKRLFANGLPSSDYTMHTLRNTDANWSNIVKYYGEVRSRTRPEDAMFCYYSGHGATDASTQGHYLCMHGGGCKPGLPSHNVKRMNVLQQMQSTGAKLSVLMTDCCSSMANIPRGGAETTEYARKPYLAQLLQTHHGVIDWQAASPGETAAGMAAGGRFTLKLCSAWSSGRHNGWEVLFQEVKSQTLNACFRKQTPYEFRTSKTNRQ